MKLNNKPTGGYKPPKNRIGSLKKAKSGILYIEVEQDMPLGKGDRLYLKTPQQDVDGLVTAGIITEEQGAERKAKIPDFVKYLVDKGTQSKI